MYVFVCFSDGYIGEEVCQKNRKICLMFRFSSFRAVMMFSEISIVACSKLCCLTALA